MSDIYTSSNPYPKEQCSICLTPLNEDVLCHAEKHPVHKKCIKGWLYINSSCPICKVDIDTSELYSFTERTINCISLIPIPNAQSMITVAAGIALGLITTPANVGIGSAFVSVCASSIAGFGIESITPEEQKMPFTLLYSFVGSYVSTRFLA